MVKVNLLQPIPNFSGGFCTVGEEKKPMLYAEAIMSLLFMADSNEELISRQGFPDQLTRFRLSQKITANIASKELEIDFTFTEQMAIKKLLYEVPVSFVVLGRLVEIFGLE